MKKLLNSLRKRAGITSLLSKANSNPKVAKNGKLGVFAAVLHLAPGDMSGHEVCHKRSPGCTAACIHFAGNPGYMTGKNRARIARTKLFFADRDLFMNILALEIALHNQAAAAIQMEGAIRLNGTSDIVWENKKFTLFNEVAQALEQNVNIPFPTEPMTIITLFDDTTYYDYTKIPGRTPPANYYLLFSETENNFAEVQAEMRRGMNIASVFQKGSMPKFHLGRQVIDGDEHDYRPADPLNVVVGLKAKGTKAFLDKTGFAQHLQQEVYAEAA